MTLEVSRGFKHDANPGGRHSPRSGRAKRWRYTLLVVAIAVLIAGGVAVAAPVRRFILSTVTAPVTVQGLSIDVDTPTVGQLVTAGARIVAKRPQVFDVLVLMARDEAGSSYDFPATENWSVGTTQKEFTASRTFDKAGVYTYWVGFRKGNRWTNLSPRRTFTVVDPEGDGPPGPTPTPSGPAPSASAKPRPSAAPPSLPGPVQGTGFPNANNTGVPTGTVLTPYTGPCTITANNTVINARTVNCDVTVQATGVVIKNSRIVGFVSTQDGSSFSFTLTDSTVDAAPGAPRLVTGVGADNFTVLRSEIIGGNRGIYCRRNCEVRDSWVHGTKVTADWHASGIRASQGSRIIHNTIACDTQPTPQDGGCSADVTMYGDFEAVRDVRVEANLFVANTGSAFCTYGGSTSGKPYSGGAANIVFVNNVFQRGTNRNCAAYGPVSAFDSTRPGNQWTNNMWSDGGQVKP